MSSPFEGMGKVLAGALGASVIFRPLDGESGERRWHLREFPELMLEGDLGPVHGATAELRVPRDEAVTIKPGDRVERADGKIFKIGPARVTPNPASDGLVPFPLSEVPT